MKYYFITYSCKHRKSLYVVTLSTTVYCDNPYVEILKYNKTDKYYKEYSILFLKEITEKEYNEISELDGTEEI